MIENLNNTRELIEFKNKKEDRKGLIYNYLPLRSVFG